MTRGQFFALMLAFAGAAPACGSDSEAESSGAGGSGGLPNTPPSSVTKLAATGFVRPLDVVVRHDGSAVYFSGETPEPDSLPAIFALPVEGGTATVLHAGAPL